MPSPGSTVGDALASRSDVVLIEDTAVASNDRQVRDAWARIASERERGLAIVFATTHVEQAYRSDRVSFAMWDESRLVAGFRRLSDGMTSLVDDFLRVFEAGKGSPTAALALRLQRLNRAARDFDGEARRHAWARMRGAAAELASRQVNDRVLEAAIRNARDD
jgi:hypothetical protein